MMADPELATSALLATDGLIAAGNLRSTLAQSWNGSGRRRCGRALPEGLIEQEQLNAQSLGDLDL